VKGNRRSRRVQVVAGSESLISSAGGSLLIRTAAVCGLDQALSARLAPWRAARASHDPGKIVLDLAAGRSCRPPGSPPAGKITRKRPSPAGPSRCPVGAETADTRNEGKLVIGATGLVKRFGSTVALDGLDLELARGKFHGFLRPNGAGKSATISVLLGMLRKDEGEQLPRRQMSDILSRHGPPLVA
jgi:ABC-type multidrug transport system fused ATPase/permease subunit